MNIWLFCQAYERNHREESLRQYLIAVLLCNNEEGYKEKAKEYRVDLELDNSIHELLKEKRSEAEASEALQQIRNLKDMAAQGKMSEFYRATDELIGTWKDKVRLS
jgi:hypothetical protein